MRVDLFPGGKEPSDSEMIDFIFQRAKEVSEESQGFGTLQGPVDTNEARRVEAIVKERLMGLERDFEDPVIRDILPGTDLNGISGEIWQQDVSALGYAMNYSGQNPSDRAFVIFGAKQNAGTPRTTAIRFFDGTGRTRLKGLWQVESMETEENRMLLADVNSLIEYGYAAGFNVDFYGRSAGLDHVILLGKVIEPKGATVAPSDGQ